MGGHATGDDAVVDLDAPPSGRPLRSWPRWQSLAVVGVAVVLAVAGAHLVLRPEAAPVAEVVGLQGGPVVAWQLPTTDEDLWAAGGCGNAGVLVRDTLRSNWVGCLDLEDGHVVWETEKLPQDPTVTELVGTPYIRVADGRPDRLLDRGTGDLVSNFERCPAESWPCVPRGQKSEPPPMPALVASDTGTLFWAEIGDKDRPGPVRLSRLRGTDPADAEWTADLDRGGSLLDGAAISEDGGLLWIPEPDGAGSTGASDVVRATDGQVPGWSRGLRNLVHVDGVAVGHSGTGVRGIDLTSGRTLWERDARTQGIVPDSEALYLTAEPQPAEPEPGGVVIRVDPRSGREVWSVTLPQPVGTVEPFDDCVLVAGQAEGTSSVLTLLERGDGAVRWTSEIVGSFSELFFGEGQVLVVYNPADGGGTRLAGLDLETGKSLWDTRLPGEPTVVGHRLVVSGEGAFTVYG